MQHWIHVSACMLCYDCITIKQHYTQHAHVHARRTAKDPEYYCWWHSLLQAGNHATSHRIVFTLKVWAVAIRNSGFKYKNLEFFESILRLWSAALKPDGFPWSNATCVDVLLWLANVKLLSNQRAWSLFWLNLNLFWFYYSLRL